MFIVPSQHKKFCTLIFQSIESYTLDLDIGKKLACGESTDADFEKKLEIRDALEDLCSKLQKEFQDDILTPFRVDRNGEAEVILGSNKYVESILSETEKSFGSLIFGVGENTLHIFDPENVSICDGPAFWDARDKVNAMASLIKGNSSAQKKR